MGTQFSIKKKFYAKKTAQKCTVFLIKIIGL